MRDIPCPRAWDDVLGKMLYSRVKQFDDSLMFRFEEHFETDTPIYMWPTGLKDKNGKEVYEGDRYRLSDDIGTVIFDRGAFWIEWDEPYQWGIDRVLYRVHNLGEIIGSIYDNPELLQGTNTATANAE